MDFQSLFTALIVFPVHALRHAVFWRRNPNITCTFRVKKKLLVAENTMLISISSPVRHQTSMSEEPLVAWGLMWQAWCSLVLAACSPSAFWGCPAGTAQACFVRSVCSLQLPTWEVSTSNPVNTAFWWSLDNRHEFMEYYGEHREEPASVFCKHIYLFSCKLNITDLIAN